MATEQVRDLLLHRGDVLAIGKFDSINGQPQKVAVRIDARTGRPKPWTLEGIDQDSSAFGLGAKVRADRLYIAAGGSDFTAAYGATTGRQVWRTDTSGSSQAISIFDRSTVIVGGHFQWVARSPGSAVRQQPRSEPAMLQPAPSGRAEDSDGPRDQVVDATDLLRVQRGVGTRGRSAVAPRRRGLHAGGGSDTTGVRPVRLS